MIPFGLGETHFQVCVCVCVCVCVRVCERVGGPREVSGVGCVAWWMFSLPTVKQGGGWGGRALDVLTL